LLRVILGDLVLANSDGLRHSQGRRLGDSGDSCGNTRFGHGRESSISGLERELDLEGVPTYTSSSWRLLDRVIKKSDYEKSMLLHVFLKEEMLKRLEGQ